MSNTKTIRFWVHCPGNCDGGFVKLTLRPDESLTWGRYRRHEEGWSFEGITWSYEGDELRQTRFSDGVDCDGRLAGGKTWVCPIAEIADEAPNDFCQGHYDCRGVMLPAWREEKAWRRDYAAEAAGY